jgi:hypothetical protein
LGFLKSEGEAAVVAEGENRLLKNGRTIWRLSSFCLLMVGDVVKRSGCTERRNLLNSGRRWAGGEGGLGGMVGDRFYMVGDRFCMVGDRFCMVGDRFCMVGDRFWVSGLGREFNCAFWNECNNNAMGVI